MKSIFLRKKRNEKMRFVRVLNDNDLKRQIARKNFFINRKTFGSNACRKGLVWRALDPYDYVCVSEERYPNLLISFKIISSS